LRLNPGVAAQTHAAVRTGDGDSKFGFGEHELEAPLATARRTPGLRLLGIHVHLGSQIFAQGPYLEALARALSAYRCVLASGAPGGVLVIGGGFGVDPLPGAAPFALADTLAALAAALDGACAEASLVRPVLGIEPGRFLVAEAGISLYRVLALKDRGTRRFAIVDGSLADNPRPALYDAYHHPALASRESAAPLVETTVCGRSCENDELAAAPLPADLAPGDLLALATTGAYTFSMASNYNRFVRPPLVFAGGGTHRAVVRRESIDDLLRTELPCDAP
ncbi:MAG: diaminopimelate decarboxylase family protein, partial [Vulcanimicrobiaceae bacterium]